MDYRNALGTFTFDDNVQESHMKLIVQNVTGQYLNPKKGEPELTDEESCYEFIRERCGKVLGEIGFELEINDAVRVRAELTHKEQVAQMINAFDDRIAKAVKEEFRRTQRRAFMEWIVGPAAIRS